MTREQTDQVMRAYLDALINGSDFAEYFADDVGGRPWRPATRSADGTRCAT